MIYSMMYIVHMHYVEWSFVAMKICTCLAVLLELVLESI